MNIPRLFAIAIFPALTCAMPVNAVAGPYGDDMAKCLVKSASVEDRNAFLKWLFVAIALHPEIQSMASISAAQRDEINKNAGALFMRLLTESCRIETQQAAQYEGPATIQYAFQIFGQVASRDLMGNPHVAEGMKGLAKYIDEAKLKALTSSAPTGK